MRWRDRSLYAFFVLLLLGSLSGCAGNGALLGDLPPSLDGPQAIAQRQSSADLHLISGTAQLQEQKSLRVNDIDVVGRDVSGAVVFGPRSVNPAADVYLRRVPSNVVRLDLHYHRASQTVAVASTPVNLTSQAVVQVAVPALSNVDEALLSLSVTPPQATVPARFGSALHAMATLTDDSVIDVSSVVQWSSDDPDIATVTADGVVSGERAGSAQISAVLNGRRAAVPIEVSGARLTSIMLLPSGGPTLPAGWTDAVTAMGVFSDGSTLDVTRTAVWSSSNSFVATATENGVIRALNPGAVNVQATWDGVSSALDMTVTAAQVADLQLDAASRTLVPGVPQTVHATALLTDGTTLDVSRAVAWVADNHAATVSGDGTVAGTAAGEGAVGATFSGKSAVLKVQTKTVTLRSITVTPARPSIPLKFSQAFTATGVYSDGSQQNLTASATWSVSSSVASISNATGSNGLATGLRAGTVNVTAASGSVKGSTTLTVTSVSLKSIQLTPAAPTVPAGLTEQFTATGIMSNGTKIALNGLASWSSNNAALATVNGSGLASAVATGSATISAAYVGVSGSTPLTVSAPQLTSLQITPPTASVPSGETQAFSAMGIYSDKSSHTVTTSVTWTSTATSVATVSNVAGLQGVATVVGTGTTTIGASLNGIKATAALTGTAAVQTGLQVSPGSASVAAGYTQNFSATALYSDGSHKDVTPAATWTSSNVASATVSAGVASAAAVGTSTVQVSYGGYNASASVTVTPAVLLSMQVAPANPTVAAGVAQQFSATGLYSDGSHGDVTSSATWSSGNASVTVSNAAGSCGQAATTVAGTAQITASLNGINGSTTLTVGSAQLTSLQIQPAQASVAAGLTQQFTATGLYTDGSHLTLTNAVTWQVGNSAAAGISNVAGSNGLATGTAVGTSAVTASLGAVSAQASLTITAAQVVSVQLTPAQPSVAAGYTQQFDAVALFTDGSHSDVTSQATWTTSDGTIASVGEAGMAQGVKMGSATIGVGYSGASASTTLTVSAAVLTGVQVSPTQATVAAGLTQQFGATGIYSDGSKSDVTSSVTWSSDNAVVSMSNSAPSCGLASTSGQGTANITASLGGCSGGASLTVTAAVLTSLQVTPPTASQPLGLTQQFTATGFYSDGSSQNVTNTVTWSVPADGVSAISNVAGSNGSANALGMGSTTVTAAMGGQTAQASFTVTSAQLVSLQLTPPSASVPAGLAQQYDLRGTFTDGTTPDLTTSATWSVSDTTLAGISNVAGSNGLASGLKSGQVTVIAAYGGQSVTAQLSVTAALLQSLEVDPPQATVAAGYTQQFDAVGHYSDGSTQDVTGSATWSTGNGTVASISNAAGAAGLASALTSGSSTVTATVNGVSQSATLTVTPAVLVEVDVSPVQPSVPVGLGQTFTATGIFSDQTHQDLTGSASWSTSDSTILALVGNQATGVAQGSVTVTATSGGVSGAASVQVTPAVLQSLQITAPSGSLPSGTSEQLAATGIFSDTSKADVTTQVAWSCAANATVSASGQVSGTAVGQATIQASLNGVSTTFNLTVSSAVLQSITITPVNAIVPRGTTTQFTATGVYSDNSTQNLTADVGWSVSDSSVASISNGIWWAGQLTAMNLGPVTVTAVYGNLQAQVNATVTAAVVTAVQITPAVLKLPTTFSASFNATAVYSDNTTQNVTNSATWTSSNTTLAAVTNYVSTFNYSTEGGVVRTFTSPGVVSIMASFGGVTGSSQLTVTTATLKSLSVTPYQTTIAAGTTEQLHATGTFSDGTTADLTDVVTWYGDSYVSISNAIGSEGLATARAPIVGECYAAILGNLQGICAINVVAGPIVSLQITPANPTLSVGQYTYLSAIATLSNGSTTDLTEIVTWSSSAPSIANVWNQDEVEGGSLGTATVTAAVPGTSVTAKTLVTVAAPTLTGIFVSPTSGSVRAQGTLQFQAYAQYSDNTGGLLTGAVTWSSSNSAVATVSNAWGSYGLVTTYAPGSSTATITATDPKSGLSGSATVNVTAALVSVQLSPAATTEMVGQQTTWTALGTMVDGSQQNITSSVAFSSSNASVLDISTTAGTTSGVALNPGQASVTGVDSVSGISQTITINVSPNQAPFDMIYFLDNYGLQALEFNSSNDSFARLPQVTDPGVKWGGTNITSAITPNGEFLYLASGETIEEGVIGSNGSPVWQASLPSGLGIEDMVVEPSGRYLIVSNDGTSGPGLSAYLINADGTLTLAATDTIYASVRFLHCVSVSGSTFLLADVQGEASTIEVIPISTGGTFAFGAATGVVQNPGGGGVGYAVGTSNGNTMVYISTNNQVAAYSLTASGVITQVGLKLTTNIIPGALVLANVMGSPTLFVGSWNGGPIPTFNVAADGSLSAGASLSYGRGEGMGLLENGRYLVVTGGVSTGYVYVFDLTQPLSTAPLQFTDGSGEVPDAPLTTFSFP